MKPRLPPGVRSQLSAGTAVYTDNGASKPKAFYINVARGRYTIELTSDRTVTATVAGTRPSMAAASKRSAKQAAVLFSFQGAECGSVRWLVMPEAGMGSCAGRWG